MKLDGDLVTFDSGKWGYLNSSLNKKPYPIIVSPDNGWFPFTEFTEAEKQEIIEYVENRLKVKPGGARKRSPKPLASQIVAAQWSIEKKALCVLIENSYEHHTPYMICIPTEKWKEAMAILGREMTEQKEHSIPLEEQIEVVLDHAKNLGYRYCMLSGAWIDVDAKRECEALIAAANTLKSSQIG